MANTTRVMRAAKAAGIPVMAPHWKITSVLDMQAGSIAAAAILTRGRWIP